MSDYNRTKNSKYILPKAVYNIVIWQIRDYYRMKETAAAILEESAAPADGMPHGSPSPDGVINKVARRLELLALVELIDDELGKIPKDYRRGVWNNILYRTAFPQDADRTTYARYKSKMIYNIAERRHML